MLALKIPMNINQILFFLLFLFYGINSYAQQHNFTNYSVMEGLAQSQVSALLEDGKGYLWVGTRGGGLCKFDGNNFTTYTTQDGLSSNYIAAIFEDKGGTLWISTANGINQLKNDTFSIFNQLRKEVVVHDFEQDDTGKIWIVDEHLNYLESIDDAPVSKGRKNSFQVLYKNRKGQIWTGGKTGLFQVIDKGLVEIKRNNGDSFKDIRAMAETADGIMWVATYNEGMLLIDDKRVIRILGKKDGLISTKIQTVTTDRSDNVWLGTTDKGVIVWQPKIRKFTTINTRQGLPNNNVQSILEDSWGNIWLGTSGGGLSKYGGQQFEHFTKTEGVKGNYIQAIELDKAERLWVATADNGVQVFQDDTFINFSENTTLKNTTCKAIFTDRLGHVWFGTADNGVTVFLDSLFLSFTAENGLAGNQVTEITEDTLGNIWVASANNGISRIAWNDTIPSQSIFTNFTTQEGLPSNQINDSYVDQQNRVWVATNGGGIALIEKDTVIKTFTRKEGLAGNIIRSFSADDLGFLWYGTASFGIGNIDLNGASFAIKNDYKGLISNNIKLLQSDENNLWIGSEKGLEYLTLDGARNMVSKEYFGQREGFRGIETSLNTVVKDGQSNLWFGTVNGLTKYNKTIQKGVVYPPKIHLQSAKLFDQNLQETPYGNQSKVWTNIKLPHDQNELSFIVEGLHLSYPNALKYQWKLEGVDADWSKPNSNNGYQRTFLPGNYTLKVRATTDQKEGYSPILSFPFEIVPPFWQTWYFKLITFLVGLFLIGFFIKWRIGLVKRKAQQIQDRLKQDKKLLELEQKALQLQMNPHFIFNALNSIQGVITPTDIKTARLQLAKFSKLMRATLENARTTTITLEEEINTLTNYLSLEQFSRGNIFDYEITVVDNIDHEAVYLPSMILQPFVENAIIHGVAHLEKRGKIKVLFARKGKRLNCVVEDNGIGRTKAKELKSQITEGHNSAALDITRERLNLLRSGKAAKNSLQIIDLMDEKGNALGTRVEVIIPIEED